MSILRRETSQTEQELEPRFGKSKSNAYAMAFDIEDRFMQKNLIKAIGSLKDYALRKDEGDKCLVHVHEKKDSKYNKEVDAIKRMLKEPCGIKDDVRIGTLQLNSKGECERIKFYRFFEAAEREEREIRRHANAILKGLRELKKKTGIKYLNNVLSEESIRTLKKITDEKDVEYWTEDLYIRLKGKQKERVENIMKNMLLAGLAGKDTWSGRQMAYLSERPERIVIEDMGDGKQTRQAYGFYRNHWSDNALGIMSNGVIIVHDYENNLDFLSLLMRKIGAEC